MKLQDRVTMMQTEKRLALKTILDLYKYMQSHKFNRGNELDGYINVNDVFARLQPAVSVLQED